MSKIKMAKKLTTFLWTLMILGGIRANVRSYDVHITEFMAYNDRTLADEDLDYPDWVELYNAGAETVNLAGWTLTDREGKLRWQFPDVELAPMSFLVVFASEKNRINPSSNLHTSFRLNDIGNYLALIAPDGETVVSEFKPQYPPQQADISYGPNLVTNSTVLVATEAPARILIPENDDLGMTWTDIEFNDEEWLEGTTGIGYDDPAQPAYQDQIKTDTRDLMKDVNTSVYIRIPFLVGDPSKFSSMAIRLKYEDGFTAFLNGKMLARQQSPAALHWNSRASRPRAADDALVFSEIDVSNSLSQLQPGKNVLAIQGLNFNAADESFLILPELEAFEIVGIDMEDQRYYLEPTPGRANRGGLPGVAEDPQFSHLGGTFVNPISLEISVESPNATIRYTINRSEPRETSPLYEGPILINQSTVLRVKVFEPGLVPSPTATQVYFVVHESLGDFSSNLPLLFINTFTQPINDTAYRRCYLSVFHTYDGRSSLQNPSDFSSEIGLRYRGSSSLGFPKKMFALETYDGNGKERGNPLLGLPKESDWVLYAPYSDKTLMRNVLSYKWSNDIGRWAPRTKFCELFLTPTNTPITMGHYQGVYVLIEKIKWGKDRVDIEKLYRSQNAEPEISGGYVLKKDRRDPGDQGFNTSRTDLMNFVHPKEREITAQQRGYIVNFLNRFEQALYGGNFRDPELGYANYIDVDSFVDHHIMVELTKNIDGFRLSTFMFKDRGGKLNMGPVWDYNLSLGNANYLAGSSPQGWYYPQLGVNEYPWYPRLFQDPAFNSRYGERWFELRKGPLALDKLLADIETNVELLQESQERNFQKWRILGTYVWPNPVTPPTYEGEISFMTTWLKNRVAWIDSTLIPPPVFSESPGQVEPGFTLTITAPTGTIYYTLDGTDPRLGDGNLAPGAKEYTGPIVLEKNARIYARAREGNVWSRPIQGLYIVSIPPLVVTEIMYYPLPPPEGSEFQVDDFEFLEIKNIGDAEIHLAGFQILDGPRYTFGEEDAPTLLPGHYLVLAKNPAAFATRYNSQGMTLAGPYTGGLSNSRGRVRLLGPLMEQIQRFSYNALWYPETKGEGHSLVIINPEAPTETWDDAESWRKSSFVGGSPGAEDPPPPPDGWQLPGDLTQNGILSLYDVVLLLKILLLGESIPLPCEGDFSSPANVSLMDSDGDGEIVLTDIIHLLSYIFLEGDPPQLGTDCTQIPGCPDACKS